MDNLPDGFFGLSRIETAPVSDGTVYRMSDTTGTGIMTCYQIFSGISLIYNDFHMASCYCEAVVPSCCVELNHCREGRIEVEYGGQFCYLGEGDFICASKDICCTASCFPLSHYHGISVILDFSRIGGETDLLLSGFLIDTAGLKRHLFGGGRQFVLRKNRSVEHIFSELYTVHDSVRLSYLKIKVLELLLFVSVPENLSGRTNRRICPAPLVYKIRKIRAWISGHLDEHFTLEDLARQFDMSQTSMKTCFRDIYGKPVAAFVRELRMQSAARLLRTTEQTVMDIALSVGYDNPSKFASAFRGVMRCNPAEYRMVTAEE
jgi:AraC-like DNA-binding protein